MFTCSWKTPPNFREQLFRTASPAGAARMRILHPAYLSSYALNRLRIYLYYRWYLITADLGDHWAQVLRLPN